MRPDLEDQWYEALRMENSLTVMRLLEEDSRLLKLGWKFDPPSLASGRRSPRTPPTPPSPPPRWPSPPSPPPRRPPRRPHQQEYRTALHVGARRGCVDLIKQVLLLCGLKEVSNYRIVDEQSEADNISARAGLRRKFQKAVSIIIASNRLVHALRKEAHLGTSELPKSSSMEKEMTGEQSEDDGSDQVRTYGASFSRKDVTELLYAKHGLYKLDALEMAALHFNMDIVVLLLYAYSQCDNPPTLFHDLRRPVTLSPRAADEKDRAYNENRVLLRQATRQFIDSLNDDSRTKYFEEYFNDPDFNFLPLEEYLFHFSCTGKFDVGQRALWEEIKSFPGSLWRFVLELHHGQGRTPFHVAVDSGKAGQFVKLFPNEAGANEMVISALTARDSAGRTPAHRAAVMFSDRGLEALVIILAYSKQSAEISATCHALWRHPCYDYGIRVLFRNDKLPWRSGNCSFWYHIPEILSFWSQSNGLREIPHGYSPLHGAVIHRNYKTAKLLVRESLSDLSLGHTSWYFRESASMVSDKPGHFANISTPVIEWGLIEFACLVRADIEFVRFLLKEYLPDFKRLENRGGKEDRFWLDLLKAGMVKRNPWQAFHLVAFSGDYEMMELFIDDQQSDPFVEDFEGNTTLHHALKVTKFEFGFHLLDIFLDFQQIMGFDLGRFRLTLKPKEVWEERGYRERYRPYAEGERYEPYRPYETYAEGGEGYRRGRGFLEYDFQQTEECITLLLQSGCDILQQNLRKQVPYPQGDLKKSRFLSWWRGIQEKEFLAAQNKANFDSNAISVTAALVATASYVGPLQPPMGYTGDPNQIHDNNVWVVLFIVCDTLSFYLAIASIILSIILCVPRRQQSIMEDLLRSRKMLTYAIGLLFPSVFFVFVAFGCSSLAVISASVTSSAAGGLTVATTCVGVLFCLVTVFVTLMKLLAFLFPRNKWIRYAHHYLS